MLSVAYDFHLHSCLSPCGEEDMTPCNIAGMVMLQGLKAFALTDHNSCKNCPAAAKAAEEYGLIFLPGMELTTEEEVHVVCLFDALPKAMAFDAMVHGRILPVPNDPAVFGRQQIMGEEDQQQGEEELLLINATTIPFDEAFRLCGEYGGVAFPAHVDKSANSLFANLGFIPPGCDFTCTEVKNPSKLPGLYAEHPELKTKRILTSSDAHYLQDISEPEHFLHVEEPSPAGVLEALRRGKQS